MMRFQDDPFAAHRCAGGYSGQFSGETVPVLVNYRDIRQAAGNWEQLSNDAPGRIQIPAEDDVRSLRQLPIETDPPQHTAYKALVQDYFRRPRTDPEIQGQLRSVIVDVLKHVPEDCSVDGLQEIALPIQSQSLAVLLGLPLSEAEGWLAWGLHAFKSGDGNNQDAADRLLKLIERYTDQALTEGGDDFFSFLANARIEERSLTRDEIIGFAHVIFSGGRDTLINCIATAMAHFAESPGDLDHLRENPRAIPIAAEEIVRFTSPLFHIGRICSHATRFAGIERYRGERVSLCWAAANRDPEFFTNAGALNINRQPNPHIAFGSGPHNCLGSTHAREVLKLFVRELAVTFQRIRPHQIEQELVSIGGPQFPCGFHRLRLSFCRK